MLALAILYSEIHSAVIYPNSLSDHCVITSQLTLAKTPTNATRWRFNTTLLKNNDYCDHFRNTVKTFISEDANSVEDPRVLWATIKGFVRNTTILFASYLNRTWLSKINSLENELRRLEQLNRGMAPQRSAKRKSMQSE